MKIRLVGVKDIDKESQNSMQVMAAAGGLSHWRGGSGLATDFYDYREDKDNEKFLTKIEESKHTSVLEHRLYTFALDNYSVLIEQLLISFRIGTAFTVKSRRYVNHNNTGFYVPSFDYLSNGKEIKDEYKNHVDFLFKKYSELQEKNVPLEDARFVLPYSFHSHMFFTANVRELQWIITYCLTGEVSLIPEVREFGEKLKDIVLQLCPFLKNYFDNLKVGYVDETSFLDKYIPNKIETIDKVNELGTLSDEGKVNNGDAIDYSVIRAHLMGKYGIGSRQAYDIYLKLNDEEKEKIIETVIKTSSSRELEQIVISFEGSMSLASFTHLTRQRLQGLLYPNFQNIDIIDNFIIPRTVIKNNCLDSYNDLFNKNIELYRQFQSEGVNNIDLSYLNLSGNKIPFCTTINLRELVWILRLRECNNAQWEIREFAHELHNIVASKSIFMKKYIGPSCNILGYCPEMHGCGKVKKLGE